MKTTLEIPDSIFRRAKALAAEQGIPFRQLVADAVEEKVRARQANGRKPWIKLAGRLRPLRKDSARINRVME